MFSFLLVGIVLFGFFRSGGVPTLLPSARRYRTADQFRVQRHISPDKSGNRTFEVLGLHFSGKRVYKALGPGHMN
jgi:hypothetical protein